ncbi:MAG: 3'-5' exonuclease [Thermoplasmata archaeon]
MVGIEEGILPYTLASDIDIEEERRLFYVGLTRAKTRVICTSTSERNLYGKVIKNKISRFIEEIGDLIESKCILKKHKNKPTQLSLFGSFNN